MISPTLMAQVRADLDRWEKPILWMYLDSQGLVTVGCGTMLPAANSASAIPFLHEKTGQAATRDEVVAAWDQLHVGSATQKAALPKNKFVAEHYRDVTDLRITVPTASSLRDNHIMADYHSLLSIYPNFDTFPDNAKLALFDMIYNLGQGRRPSKHHRATGLRRYRAMNTEINKGQWIEAASHSTRHGIPADRNRMTTNLFRSCAPKPQDHATPPAPSAAPVPAPH